jgi:hypothetical protein
MIATSWSHILVFPLELTSRIWRYCGEPCNDMANTQHVNGAIYEYHRLAPRIPPSFADRSWTIGRKSGMLPQTHVSILGAKVSSAAFCKEVNGFDILVLDKYEVCGTQRHSDENFSQGITHSARNLGDSDTESRQFMRVNTRVYTYSME